MTIHCESLITNSSFRVLFLCDRASWTQFIRPNTVPHIKSQTLHRKEEGLTAVLTISYGSNKVNTVLCLCVLGRQVSYISLCWGPHLSRGSWGGGRSWGSTASPGGCPRGSAHSCHCPRWLHPTPCPPPRPAPPLLSLAPPPPPHSAGWEACQSPPGATERGRGRGVTSETQLCGWVS